MFTEEARPTEYGVAEVWTLTRPDGVAVHAQGA